MVRIENQAAAAAGGVTYDHNWRNGPASTRDNSDDFLRGVFQRHGTDAAVLESRWRSELQSLPELAAGGGGEQCRAVEDGTGALLQLHRSLHHRRAVPARSPIRSGANSELRRRNSGRWRWI